MQTEKNTSPKAKYVSYKTLKLLWKLRQLEQDNIRDIAKVKLVK